MRLWRWFLEWLRQSSKREGFRIRGGFCGGDNFGYPDCKGYSLMRWRFARCWPLQMPSKDRQERQGQSKQRVRKGPFQRRHLRGACGVCSSLVVVSDFLVMVQGRQAGKHDLDALAVASDALTFLFAGEVESVGVHGIDKGAFKVLRAFGQGNGLIHSPVLAGLESVFPFRDTVNQLVNVCRGKLGQFVNGVQHVRKHWFSSVGCGR